MSERIDPGNAPPQVTIDSPTTTARFAVGETITLRATATDAEDGALPASSLSWRVLRHHDAHTHPFLAPTSGNNLTIQQPAPEDLGSGIDGYLQIQLTATDSSGVTTVVTRDVLPRKVALTFATSPAGRQVVVAGATYTGPSTLTSWEGHTIAVDVPAQADGWTFQSWSDGGAACALVRDAGCGDDVHRHVRPQHDACRPRGGLRPRRGLRVERGRFVGSGECRVWCRGRCGVRRVGSGRR